MTAQIAERLLYQGQSLSMCSNPLGDYFAMGGERPRFQWGCTALWRGYVGQWEILNDHLYLLALHGTLEDGTSASLATVFPDFPDRVFAHWYSGALRVPQGRRLKYVHMGYASIHERDLLLEIECGVLVASHVQHHGTAGSEGDGEGYGAGAMTVFPPAHAGDGGAS
ncbi:hypothetical protein [Thauera aminoaromatica]|jgi:hypothetical protein|uniref:hypothetical protein n=1 Tax=Thauera aminoaromatica TaxID=164330 RepID=UPI0023F448DB|nr:hypothetical protein [Thauera aminoaromatica]